jgi:1-acyl-sn-glycerol-3-phosphate acyltransferase
MYSVKKYRINNIREIRKSFREITAGSTPTIVCCNHLTLVDSILIIWALASQFTYLRHYRLFCWNLPAVENTKKFALWLIITYFNKCILLDRLASPEKSQENFEILIQLLKSGDLIMLFPEGTRSRCGKITGENLTYGIGKLLQRLPDSRVLCIYFRGRSQVTYSDFPKQGDIFDLQMTTISPKTELSGLRGAKDLSSQVLTQLQELEKNYFLNINPDLNAKLS